MLRGRCGGDRLHGANRAREPSLLRVLEPHGGWPRATERTQGSLGRRFDTDAPLGQVRAATDMANVSRHVPAIHPCIGIDSDKAVNDDSEFARHCISPAGDAACRGQPSWLAWTTLDGEARRNPLESRAPRTQALDSGVHHLRPQSSSGNAPHIDVPRIDRHAARHVRLMLFGREDEVAVAQLDRRPELGLGHIRRQSARRRMVHDAGRDVELLYGGRARDPA